MVIYHHPESKSTASNISASYKPTTSRRMEGEPFSTVITKSIMNKPNQNIVNNQSVNNVNSVSSIPSNSSVDNSGVNSVNNVNMNNSGNISFSDQGDTSMTTARLERLQLSNSYIDAPTIVKSREALALTHWCTTPLNQTAPHVGDFKESLMARDWTRDVSNYGQEYYNSNTQGLTYVVSFRPNGLIAARSGEHSSDTDASSVDGPSAQLTRSQAAQSSRDGGEAQSATESGGSSPPPPNELGRLRADVRAQKTSANLLARQEFFLPQESTRRMYILCLNNVVDRRERIGDQQYYISTHGNFRHRDTLIPEQMLYTSDVPDDMIPASDFVGEVSNNPALKYVANPSAIPVSHCQVTICGLPSDMLEQSSPPTTSVYDQFIAKLNENDAKDALRSMISRASIVDGASLLTLVSMMGGEKGSSFRDVSPLLVCHLLLNSLDKSLFLTSCDWSRLVRNTYAGEQNLFSMYIREWNRVEDMPVANVSYVSLARFTQLIAGQKDEPRDSVWHRSRMDLDWIAIPVTSELLTFEDITGYVFAYMTSEFWNGRINWWRPIAYTTANNSAEFSSCTFMPASNSVYVPGVNNIMLVQMTGSGLSSSRLTCRNIPIVFTADNAAQIVTTDVRQAWRDLFTLDNAADIRQAMHNAYHYMVNRTIIGTSAGRALFLASEITCKTSAGLRITSNKSGPDRSVPLGGLWTYGSTAYGQENWASGDWLGGNSATNHNRMNNRMTGYNFSLASPLGVVPASATNLVITNTQYGPYRVSPSFWAGTTPRDLGPADYVVQRATSFSRLGAAAHLIETHSINSQYHFPTVAASSSFCVHLGAAMGGSLNIFLLRNDIEYRHWVGWENRKHRGFASNLLDIKRALFLGQIAGSTPVSQVDRADTIDHIEDYYGVSYADSASFHVYSPYPICTTIQWAEKVESPIQRIQMISSSMTFGGVRILGVKFEPSWQIQKAILAGFTNDRSAIPNIWVSSGMIAVPFYQDQWVENIGASMYHERHDDDWYTPTETRDPPILTSLTFTRALACPLEFDSTPTTMYLTRGMLATTPSESKILVSPIVLPDPFSLDSFLDWVRDYLAKPAISAGKEYLTSGSVTAAGKSALDEIAKQMEKREKAQEGAASTHDQESLLTETPPQQQ